MAEQLIVPAALRPWLKSGLSALLLESQERVEALRAAIPSQATLPAQSGQKSKPVRPTAIGAAQDAGPALVLPPTVSPAISPAVASDAAPYGAVSPVASSATILPLSRWPAPWLALKNRRPLPPRPLVFWTYAGLGDDLMGTADPERQQAVVQLLTALRHPGGTHVFWPYALPGAPLLAESPSLFWSGVELLKPRVLLVFGSEARDALGLPKSLVPFSQDRLDGRLIVQLHQPSSLVSSHDDNPLRRAIAFLSRLLSFCASQG